jgi:uncharacterized protein (TIGR02266 family)
MERRKDYRVKTRIFLLKPDEDKPTEAKISNIGPNGAFVRSDSPLPVGTRITLVFRLPGKLKKFKVPGIVRWLREGKKCGYGVEFISMGWKTKRELAKWVLKKYIDSMS